MLIRKISRHLKALALPRHTCKNVILCYCTQEIFVLTKEKIVNKVNKTFFAVLALAFTSQAHADNLKLPVGDCVLSIPEKQWCGVFTVRPNRTMKYIAGPCNGSRMEIKYRAKSITLRGDRITIDGQYHFNVTWISQLGKQASITYRYNDTQGEHTGQRSLSCGK